MAEKVTTMIIKVDLECHYCYKKIKKILCEFPQIRDQVYDEKQNTVKITVVCCNPEKIRDKLCCKGGKTIKSIEIKEPKKEPEKKKEELEKAETEKEPEKKKEELEKAEIEKEPEKEKKEPKKKDPEPAPEPVPAYSPAYPSGFCCGLCAEGHFGGPCYRGYGMPPPPPPPPPPTCYCHYGRPCCGRTVYVIRCDYFSEENPSGCTIM